MISVFDEEQYALNVLKNGLNQNKKGLDIFILAKYYKFKCKNNKKECKDLLVQFCKTQVDDYDNSDLYKNVNYAVNTVYNKDIKFLDIDYIEFNEYELSYIKSLNISPVCKQVLFGLWCCNKLNIKADKSDKWVNITYSELKKFVNLSNGNIIKIMNELYVNDLIFVSDSCAICLTFLDKYNEYANTIVAKNKNLPSPIDSYCIYDFTTCGLWWRKFNGDKKIIACAECGILTIRNSNRQKYCKECARDKELNSKILYNQMYYSKHKND
jgi:hypothetical protein